MSVTLKPVEDQVIVITGASSGIGLTTARMAAERGARVVIAARNAEALEEIAADIRAKGGEARAVTVDTARQEDLERLAQEGLRAYGRIDTWINNAAVAVYGTLEEVPLEDQRRLWDVNYWGVVQGSLIAARILKQQGGGAIINTGSVLSERTMIYQGQYSASKHAVKGFTDALRMELEAEGAPISVTLIKPSAIDTPYPEHARNYLDSPGLVTPPPAYDPHLVGKAMLFAAENPKRELTIGFGGWIIGAAGTVAPRLVDYAMELTGYASQTTENPGRKARRDNLYVPREDGAEFSSLPGGHRKTSLLLEAQMHPIATTAIVGTLSLLAAALLRGRSGGRREAPRRTGYDRDDRPMPPRYRVQGSDQPVRRPRPDGDMAEGPRPVPRKAERAQTIG